jgi:hypothetical protein
MDFTSREIIYCCGVIIVVHFVICLFHIHVWIKLHIIRIQHKNADNLALCHVNCLLKYGHLHSRYQVSCHAAHYTIWELWLSGYLYPSCRYHVAQNIMHYGSLWRYDNSLSYSLGLLNAEFVESDFQFGNQDNFNLQEDGIFTDICSQFPRNSDTLELNVVTVPMKL